LRPDYRFIDMKHYFSVIYFLLFAGLTTAQTTQDTAIYDAPESAPYPLMNNCKGELHPGWTTDSVRVCGERTLLRILSQNIRYPEAARTQNLQGVVVVRMVVEPTGRMSNPTILKDIGGGCGPEALRVIRALDSLGMRFQPATLAGKNVRAYSVLPLRFRLEEVLPYIVSEEGDTIYTNVDTNPMFKEGEDSLQRYIINRLGYPTAYKDSCKAGVIELSLLINSQGRIRVENQIDFSDLGLDYQFEALQFVNRMNGLWTPATYQGKPVPATVPVRMLFKSDEPGCTTANENFDKAMLLAAEGVTLAEAEKNEEAIAKWTSALALQPNNTELLYYRGTTYLNINQLEAACVDYNAIKRILGTTWFESVRRIVCGW
jgi:Gram-negative bacterial TonB protein C-terminal